MIDLIQTFDKHEDKISGYVTDRVAGYYKSECYKLLSDRKKNLGLSNDLRPASTLNNSWISQVVFPIVKERSLLRRAITSANYRTTDIYTVESSGATPPENAADAELVLNLNMQHTQFKMNCLKPCINTASKYGTSVVYTYWKASENATVRTEYNPKTGMYERVRSYTQQKNACNEPVDILDYFQNPDIPAPESSDFQGHYKAANIGDLIPLLEDDTYICENVAKVIYEIKRGISGKSHREFSEKDMGEWRTEITYFEGTLPIKGNEDGTQRYRLQMVGKTIIRMSVDDYDHDMKSYTILNYDKRDEYWWGNSDSEYVVSHENFLNTFLSMSADNALKSMQNYIFFQKDTINPNDISRAYANQGFVQVDNKGQSLSGLISPYQPGAMNLGPSQFITQMVNDSIQKNSTKVDLSRKNDMGGGTQNNGTATAANIIAGQSDVLEADILENFDFGVAAIGLKNLGLLGQFLSEIFMARPRPQDVERVIEKYRILGEFYVKVNTNAMKNRQNELLRMQNLATWLLNVTSNPALAQAGYNVAPIVRDILQKAELPSVEDVIPKENEMQNAPGMVPSAQPMQQMQPQLQPQGGMNVPMA